MIAAQELSLPMFPEMSKSQLQAVCEAVGEYSGACVR
jgi:dTDP-4-amino-4,6-dideoxygalactose transaminase